MNKEHINISRNMSDKTFMKISGFIRQEYGINLTEAKKTMLQARLQKRLRQLKMRTYEDYSDYVFSPQGMLSELPHMIDVITTNKTEFFREPRHFDILLSHVIPNLAAHSGAGLRRKMRIWSAGCSTGEEVYTLAMVLSDFAEKFQKETSGTHLQTKNTSYHLPFIQNREKIFHFQILGTDVSNEVLQEAALGIYSHQKVENVPLTLRKKYMLRSKDKTKDRIRMTLAIRNCVTFKWLNFMDPNLSPGEKQDVVFLRNVLIYFDRNTQEGVLRRILNNIVPGGYLFLGHSETLNGLNLPLELVTSTVYRKPQI